MDNHVFLDDEENKLLVSNHDQDRDDNNGYDNYNAGNTSRVAETTLMPGSNDKQATSTLQLRQKVEHSKLAELYRHLLK